MSDEIIQIFYDGECPFCTRYVKLLRIREAVGSVELVNLRDSETDRIQLNALGYDVDEGMVAKYAGRYYHGSECVELLAMLSTGSAVFNRINKMVLGGDKRSRYIYPVLKTGRNFVLKFMGIKKLNADRPQS